MSTSASSARAKLAWYARRLQAMPPAEVWWRAADEARKWAWQRSWARPGSTRPGADAGRAVQHSPVLKGTPAFTALLPLGAWEEIPAESRQETVAAAERLMSGRWENLGVEREDMESPDWFWDPITGRRAPADVYCFKVNHRREEVTGNVKQIWELSRMHHITVLCSAFAFTGDERYAERAAEHLRSWWRQNPWLSGVNWTSGIELGIRLIAWVWARRLLADWPGAPGLFEDNADARAQIWWHQRYLAAFRSRGTSANNHVIAEAAGQLVAALAFDWFAESEQWAAAATELLEDELAKNTFPSGVNREMAFEYHGLVAELGLVAGAEADRAGRPLDDHTWALLGRMLDVIAATVDEALGPPRYGDGDDGKALVLDPNLNRWESLLSTGRAIFGAAGWWPPTAPDAFSTCVAALAAKHPAHDRAEQRPYHFPDAGLTILRCAVDDGAEIWCRCDGGPHGFLGIAAHAHADAQAVEVRYAGVEILADPGTYCYHGEPEWRRYFRSTLGHNTLQLDGVDQSGSGGPFLWVRHAQSRLIEPGTMGEHGNPQVWSAAHDGYLSLTPPAIHRRTVRLAGDERRLEIVDEVLTDGALPWKLAFHFGPTVEAVLAGQLVELSWESPKGERQRATMTLPPARGWTLVKGQSQPVLGWYSARFGVKVPSYSLVGEGGTAGTTPLATSLRFLPPDGQP